MMITSPRTEGAGQRQDELELRSALKYVFFFQAPESATRMLPYIYGAWMEKYKNPGETTIFFPEIGDSGSSLNYRGSRLRNLQLCFT